MKLACDRYDHDMTAERFLAWLRPLAGGHIVSTNDAVAAFLSEKGYNVVDVSDFTVILDDTRGSHHVCTLPGAVIGAIVSLDLYPDNEIDAIIRCLEARI